MLLTVAFWFQVKPAPMYGILEKAAGLLSKSSRFIEDKVLIVIMMILHIKPME